MKTLKFHFKLDLTTRSYQLIANPGPVGHTGPVTVVMSWPKTGYSFQAALARADRFVGEEVRRETHGTNQPVICVYTKEHIL